MIPEPFPLPGRLKLLLVLGAAGIAAVVALRRHAARKPKSAPLVQKAPAPGQEQWLRRVDAPPPRPRALKRAPARPGARASRTAAKPRRQKAESIASW